MHGTELQKIYCPYCGEIIEIVVENSDEPQHYIEDCQVCCRPIHFNVTGDGFGGIDVQVRHEDE
ncbi:MAG: CPXCG motif-containing cysteine-rich protein [Agarilytica sp.]